MSDNILSIKVKSGDVACYNIIVVQRLFFLFRDIKLKFKNIKKLIANGNIKLAWFQNFIFFQI